MTKFTALITAAILGATATVAAADTLGNLEASGRLDTAALRQLIATTGLSLEQARALTLDEVVAIRWQDS